MRSFLPFCPSSFPGYFRTWIGLLVPFFLTGLAGAAEEKPFTPDPDLVGTWDFPVDPNLPNVLLIGDSISVGYTRKVRERLQGKANVFRPMNPDGKTPANCGDTRLTQRMIETWLGTRRWDVIHFNWGIHDSTYRNPALKTPGRQDKVHGSISVPPEEYENNLRQLITRMQATHARLIWASSTVVPPNDIGHITGDIEKYNAVAEKVAREHHLAIDDLHSLTQSFGGKYSAGPNDVHYTAEGYEKIAAHVAAMIATMLPAKSEAVAP